jgi:hypothetical protein
MNHEQKNKSTLESINVSICVEAKYNEILYCIIVDWDFETCGNGHRFQHLGLM